jgi:hypothetical protein
VKELKKKVKVLEGEVGELKGRILDLTAVLAGALKVMQDSGLIEEEKSSIIMPGDFNGRVN